MGYYDGVDARTAELMRQQGIPRGLVYPMTSREGHVIQRKLEEIANQRQAETGLQSRLSFQAQKQAEDLALRRDVLAESKAGHREAAATREAGIKAASEDRNSAALLNVLNNPQGVQSALGTGPEAPINKAILNEFLKRSNISVNLPANAQAAALARSEGRAAPQGEVLGGTQAQPQTTLGEGDQPMPDKIPTTAFGYAEPDPNRLIQHGQIYGGPPGYDLNINTGEFVPSSLVGTINGRPAPQVVAEGALKRGVSPEDTRSRELYNMARGIQSTPQFGATGPESFRGHGAGSSWEPAELAKGPTSTSAPTAPDWTTGVGHIPTVAGATPAPGTQPTGPFTATANALSQPNVPTPTPAMTPPAIPPVNPNQLTEEQRRRLALQQ